ncbi:MAG: S8 family serine peptidase [Muribaculaceae bacterium]|nr:S8 family serine peptidase [Muribaculaceae bacterium]
MKKYALSILASLCCLVVSAGINDAMPRTVAKTRGNYVPGQVIVKFKDNSTLSINAPQPSKVRATGVQTVDRIFQEIGVNEISELMPLTGRMTFAKAARAYNGKEIKAKPMEKAYLLKLDDADINVMQVVELLKQSGEVEYAEPNYTVYTLAGEITGTPNDTYYSLQYGLNAINMPQLWAKPVIQKDGPIIAILDTGVDITHPDLEDNIWINMSEADGASFYDDDRNGFVDDIHGWDFVNQTGDIYDYNGHGTHCAGIAAACGFNGKGIVGANPDARIMPLTVMQSNGTGDIATIIKALDYATANGADIISMSLGSYSSSMAFEEALGRAYQKAVIVAAAGNDGYCLNHKHLEMGQLQPMPMFPAAYSFVLGVQASAQGGGLAAFSNYDDNGATFSDYGEEKLYNYELTVPGASIMSTYPGGGYKELNGTSMATPLVAGAVSRLLQCKEYLNKEELFGDLIHSVTNIGNLDIFAAYNITDKDRKPELQFVTVEMVDADGDGRADAGESVSFYPVIRNSWGNVSNITFTVESTETVNNTFTIQQGTAEFGVNLASYGKARALNPVKIKFNDNVVDGRIVLLKFTARAANAQPVEQILDVMVENAVELSGILKNDMTLTPDQHYVVTGTFAVPEGITLTIKPGTTLKFRDNSRFKVEGQIIANGEPGNMIKFTKADLSTGAIYPISFGNNRVSYCEFYDLYINEGFGTGNFSIDANELSHCIYRDVTSFYSITNSHWKQSSIYNQKGTFGLHTDGTFEFSNVVNNMELNRNGYFIHLGDNDYYYPSGVSAKIKGNNIFNNSSLDNDKLSFMANSLSAQIYHSDIPSYLGTAKEAIARERVVDINHPLTGPVFSTFAEYDFSNLPSRPYAEAPGIVWKVLVNGTDAQDEFDELPPLGVGRHRFDVYFNRPMNKDVTPTLAMGVRVPYTQTAIGESGKWNADGTVYTAYLTISGKSNIDGLNRIYVAGAQDDEYFEIPIENSRFNVLVQAAGSLSSGFMAEPGLGRVTLTWDNREEDNIDDILGFNMYRYEIDADGNMTDTICINRQLIEPKGEMELTDYDVVPRHTYAYFYKTMRTDMSETSPSKTVAVTPLTATRGDANGSGSVDVADVITTVNYASGMAPQPFIFEAADMNSDLAIDILDVVGIIRAILYPGATTSSLMAEATATYFVEEDGTIYIDSPVALSGIQFNARLDGDGSISGLEALKGFEQTGAWLNDENYIFMAYNMTGKTVEAGLNAIARINSGEIDEIILSDTMGNNVQALRGNGTSSIENVIIGKVDDNHIKGVYTVTGIKLAEDASSLQNLPAGVYIVNGKKVVK